MLYGIVNSPNAGHLGAHLVSGYNFTDIHIPNVSEEKFSTIAKKYLIIAKYEKPCVNTLREEIFWLQSYKDVGYKI